MSRERRDGFIAPEHLLVALAGDTEGAAGAALERVGVTRRAVLAAAERRLVPGDDPERTRIPFTGDAKRTLEMALKVRMDLGDPEVDTGHLLLGLIRTDSDVDYGLLAALGVDADALWAAVGRSPAPRRPSRRAPQVDLPPRMADVDLVALLVTATAQVEGGPPDSGDLLLALAGAGDNVAARALRAVCADLESLQAAVSRERARVSRGCGTGGS